MAKVDYEIQENVSVSDVPARPRGSVLAPIVEALKKLPKGRALPVRFEVDSPKRLSSRRNSVMCMARRDVGAGVFGSCTDPENSMAYFYRKEDVEA